MDVRLRHYRSRKKYFSLDTESMIVVGIGSGNVGEG